MDEVEKEEIAVFVSEGLADLVADPEARLTLARSLVARVEHKANEIVARRRQRIQLPPLRRREEP